MYNETIARNEYKKIDKENALDEQFKVTMKLAGEKETKRY